MIKKNIYIKFFYILFLHILLNQPTTIYLYFVFFVKISIINIMWTYCCESGEQIRKSQNNINIIKKK